MVDGKRADNLTELSRNYFLRSGDREFRAWILRDDEPSPILPSSVQFGNNEFAIEIIDHFGGRKPILLNHLTFTHEEVQIKFIKTVILDSNVVSYLHQYVTSNSTLDSKRRNAVFEFLRFVVEKEFDYNPFFYYIGAAKDEKGALLSYAEEISRSILLLHTMDDAHFLTSGLIVTDPSRLSIYEEEYGVSTLEELVPLYSRAMIQPTDPYLDGLSLLIYATLLQIALIHKRSSKDVTSKFEEMRLFMEDKLRIAMGPERMLALGYFTGDFDGFIPLQRGANPVRIFKRLRASSWDLLLLRLPALLLSIGDQEEVTVGYICSSDRVLRRVANACKIESVMGSGKSFRDAVPMMSYDFSVFQEKVGAEVFKKISERDTDWQKSRLPIWGESGERISYETLSEIVKDLETQVTHFCTN